MAFAAEKPKIVPRPAGSLTRTVLVGILLPIGMALLPLAATSLFGREPFAWMMFWASPEVLPFLGLLGGGAGAVTYWLRGSEQRRRPSVVFRLASGLAAFVFVPLPLALNRASMEAAAFLFLAPNFFFAGTAIAWRVAQWSGLRRVAAISAVAAIDTYWVVGMLAHAPERHVGLRRAALPVAVAMFAAALWRGWRTPAPVD